MQRGWALPVSEALHPRSGCLLKDLFLPSVTSSATSHRDAPSLKFLHDQGCISFIYSTTFVFSAPLVLGGGLAVSWAWPQAMDLGSCSNGSISLLVYDLLLPPTPSFLISRRLQTAKEIPGRGVDTWNRQQGTFPASPRGQAWSWDRSPAGTTTLPPQHQTRAANTSSPGGISSAG